MNEGIFKLDPLADEKYDRILTFAQENNVLYNNVLISLKKETLSTMQDFIGGYKKNTEIQFKTAQNLLQEVQKKYTTSTKYGLDVLLALWMNITFKYTLQSKPKEQAFSLLVSLRKEYPILQDPRLLDPEDDIPRYTFFQKYAQSIEESFKDMFREQKLRWLQIHGQTELEEVDDEEERKNMYDFSTTDLIMAVSLKEPFTFEEQVLELKVNSFMPLASIYTAKGDTIKADRLIHQPFQQRVAGWLKDKFLDVNDVNSIVCKLYYGETEHVEDILSEKYFTTIRYIDKYKTWYLTVPKSKIIISEDILIKRMLEHTGLTPEKVNTPTSNSVKGSFIQLNLNIVPEIYLHLIMTDWRLRSFFFIHEQQGSFAQKKTKRLTIHFTRGWEENNITETSIPRTYRPPPPKGDYALNGDPSKHTPGKLMVTFADPDNIKKQERPYQNGESKYIVGEVYTRLKFSRANSLAACLQARELLLYSFILYKEREGAIRELYESSFPPLQLRPKRTKKKSTPRTKEDPGQGETYHGQRRACQTKMQTNRLATEKEMIANPEEVKRRIEEARANPLKVGKQKGKIKYVVPDILKYNGVYYISRHPENPYIGLKTAASTKGVTLPWCYHTKQLEIDPDTCEIIRKIENKTTSATTSRKAITTLKILKDSYTGILPASINAILQVNYSSAKEALTNHNIQFYRQGVPRERESALYAILGAIQDPKYMLLHQATNPKGKSEQQQDVAFKELHKYVISRRKELSKYAIACKQELWDYSLEEIETALTDTAVYLDPLKYYRALEEFMYTETNKRYNILIFTVNRLEHSNNSLILPRHNLAHYRNYSDTETPVLLLFAHPGMDCDNAAFNQCEPIIVVDKREIKPYYANRKPAIKQDTYTIIKSKQLIEKLLHIALLRNTVYRLNLKEDEDGSRSQVIARDVQNVPRLDVTFKGIIKQQIDGIGKTRCISISLNLKRRQERDEIRRLEIETANAAKPAFSPIAASRAVSPPPLGQNANTNGSSIRPTSIITASNIYSKAPTNSNNNGLVSNTVPGTLKNNNVSGTSLGSIQATTIPILSPSITQPLISSIDLEESEDETEDEIIILQTPVSAPLNVPDDPTLYNKKVELEIALKWITMYPSLEISLGLRHENKKNYIINVKIVHSSFKDPFYINVNTVAFTEEYQGYDTYISDVPPLASDKSLIDKLQHLKLALANITRRVRELYEEEVSKQQGDISLSALQNKTATITINGKELLKDKLIIKENHDYSDDDIYEKEEDSSLNSEEEIRKIIVDSKEMRDWLYQYVDNYLNKNRVIPHSTLSGLVQEEGKTILKIRGGPQERIWLSSLLAKNRSFINDYPDAGDIVSLTEPYIVKFDGVLYLLQRVLGDLLERAQAVGYHWVKSNINVGFYGDLSPRVWLQKESFDMNGMTATEYESQRETIATSDGDRKIRIVILRLPLMTTIVPDGFAEVNEPDPRGQFMAALPLGTLPI